MVANYSELTSFLKLLPRTPRLWYLKFSLHQVSRKERQRGLQQKLWPEWKIWAKCRLAVIASSAWSSSGTRLLGSPVCLSATNITSPNRGRRWGNLQRWGNLAWVIASKDHWANREPGFSVLQGTLCCLSLFGALFPRRSSQLSMEVIL